MIVPSCGISRKFWKTTCHFDNVTCLSLFLVVKRGQKNFLGKLGKKRGEILLVFCGKKGSNHLRKGSQIFFKLRI